MIGAEVEVPYPSHLLAVLGKIGHVAILHSLAVTGPACAALCGSAGFAEGVANAGGC